MIEIELGAPEKSHPDRQRKSLAVDQHTYDLLAEICFDQRRSKIDQLKMLIEHEHDKLFLPWNVSR